MTKKISYSSVNQFHMCPYAFHLNKVKKIKKMHKSRALYIGSVIHSLLESLNRGEDWINLLHTMEQELTLEDKLSISEESILWLEDTINGYIDCFKDDVYEVVELEYKISVRFKNVSFLGYVDGIVKYGDKYYILERKTSSSAFPKEFNLLLREQPYIYAYFIEKIMNIKIEGIIWEFISSKPLTEIRIKNNGEPYANSLTSTPYMWNKQFNSTEYPKTLTYLNVFDRTIMPIEREHLKRMVSNFVEKSLVVDSSIKFKKYDSVNCTRMCNYSTWCMYELKDLDPEVLIGSVYYREEVIIDENTED